MTFFTNMCKAGHKNTKYIYLVFLLSKIYPNHIDVCESCDISGIKEAITIASPGDSIIVEPGIYYESNLRIDKSLNIIGNNVVIDAKGKGGIFTIMHDDVNLIGFTLKNPGVSYTDDIAAIHVRNTKGFRIENTTIENSQFAILVHKSENGYILNNRVIGYTQSEAEGGNGIHLWHSKDIVVRENHVTGMRDGIYFEFVDESEIENNIAENNVRYGLHFMFSNNNVYRQNIFKDNGAGVAVMISKHIIMAYNTLEQNWGNAAYGVLLKEIYDSELTSNKFVQNTIGVYAEGSTRIQYKDNIFMKNGWAVKIAGGCYENVFTQNDFISNTFDVSYFGGTNDNEFSSNYWSEYTGYDLNKDGVGDVEHHPVKLFSVIVSKTPESIILMRSMFIELLNFSERVAPMFSPDHVKDEQPQMKAVTTIHYDKY